MKIPFQKNGKRGPVACWVQHDKDSPFVVSISSILVRNKLFGLNLAFEVSELYVLYLTCHMSSFS
jgi:hypothetical protein